VRGIRSRSSVGRSRCRVAEIPLVRPGSSGSRGGVLEIHGDRLAAGQAELKLSVRFETWEVGHIATARLWGAGINVHHLGGGPGVRINTDEGGCVAKKPRCRNGIQVSVGADRGPYETVGRGACIGWINCTGCVETLVSDIHVTVVRVECQVYNTRRTDRIRAFYNGAGVDVDGDQIASVERPVTTQRIEPTHIAGERKCTDRSNRAIGRQPQKHIVTQIIQISIQRVACQSVMNWRWNVTKINYAGIGSVILDIRQGAVSSIVPEKVQTLPIITGERLGEGELLNRSEDEQQRKKKGKGISVHAGKRTA